MNKLVDATSTPLSSIFGSGFLIIVLLLAVAAALGFTTVFAVPAS